MWRIALGLVLFLAVAPMAGAEPVTVRSGDHQDFTRLVLGFDASAGWQLGRIDGGWEFRAARDDITFDLSQVFDRIPRNRIADIESPAPGVLRIQVPCACHADGFELRRGRVVIDVKDGPAPEGNPFEARLDGPSGSDATEAAPVALPAGFAEALRAAALGQAATPLRNADSPVPFEAGPEPGADFGRVGRNQEFQRMVLDQLARAASQGLIVPARLGSDRSPDTGAGAPGGPKVAEADPKVPSPGDHVRIETAVDRDNPSPDREADDLTAAGQVCPAPGRLDLSGWGYLRQGTAAIDAYRAGLTGEFDEVDPARAMALARYYAFLTFGAEARQMLGFVPRSDPDWDLVDAMAEILDHEGSAPVGRALDGYETCNSEAALWAVLAGSPLRPDQEVNENAVIRAFDGLPAHAKTLLGPRLIAAFTTAHRLEAAALLRNALDLGASERTMDAAVAGARLDAALGEPEKAEERLDSALAETDPDSPEALLALAEQKLGMGRTLAPEMIEALEAIAYEQRGTELAERLSYALARAALARGAHAEARDLILTRLPPEDARARSLLRKVYQDAAESADADSFLRLVLPHGPELGGGGADRAARLAVAERLLTLGFPDDTLALLGPGAAAGEDHATRLLAARALLAQGDAGLAVAALAALDGPEAAGVMAEAQEQLGNLDEARRLYQRAGRQADAERMAVLERDWSALLAAADPALRGLAERFVRPVAPEAAGDEPYDAAARMIEASARARAALEALLHGQ
ncbi:hypothetical protein [Frigidibacter sp. ROC022]|uniref:hypothetical protein n=1 Tax=Frigidibacter sp. ROC022 TaxID=2971796 RepID=UPI00215B0CA0|nr:hypothetical protein [Frigidibacter sp. ROC022]MCR8724358.1 hypothetical protein [Frigidibacter sp. ROC022]